MRRLYMPNGGDIVYVQVSNDGGLSWTNLISPYGAVINSTWTKEQLDLSSFKTSSVLIRFGLRDNGDGYVADGWYIDDVEIKEKDPDTAAPETTITSGPAEASCVASVSVTLGWSGSDNNAGALSYSYKMDGNAWSLFDPSTSVTFDALSEGTHTFSVKARDQAGNEDPTPAVLNFYVDATLPDLSNIASSPRDYNATVTWNTSEPATAQVEYGATSAYGMSSPLDSTMTGAHTVTIEGLTPKTTYHYRVKSNDGCREVVSGDLTFTTTNILYPNLRVMEIDMPGTVKSLEQINIKWLERNDGPGSAQGNWTDKIYLSGDEVIDSQDTLLGEFTYSDGLEWETERLREVTLDMPLMPPGTYYIIVQTDANNVIVEISENDNTLVKRIDYLTVKQLTAAPDRITISLHPGETANGEIELINLGETPLTGITAAIEASSSNISIQVVPPSSISGKTVLKVSYSVSANDDSVKNILPVIVFSTSEGQTASVTFSITVNPGYPSLASNPGYLETTMVRGSQTIAEFEVTNTGAAAASNLKIILPATDWLSLITPDSVASLGPGKKMKVGLALKPGASLALGPYTGNIAISADNANAVVNFRFTAVSDKIGGLKIIAKDEFTYFAADHPPVAGASVKIKNPFDGTMVAEGQTDANGQFAKLDLFEGFYSIEVSAEKHGTYNAIVQIIAGQVMELTAFLPRQLVTYTWKVVPVQTEDRYIVTLEAVFETHVPAPVITVEPMVLDLRTINFDADGLSTVNYKITNHGLIAAQNARIHFETHPDYEVTPLNEYIGELPAMTSLDVPVIFKRLNMQPLNAFNSSAPLLLASAFATAGAGGGSGSNPCGFAGSVDYGIPCEEAPPGSVPLTVVTGDCPPLATPGITAGSGGSGVYPGTGGGSGGGVGSGTQGGIVGGVASISGPSIQMSLPCELLVCEDGQSCDDRDNNECTSGICAYGSCIPVMDSTQTPTQKAQGDCKKEVCQNGGVVTVPDDSDLPAQSETDDCRQEVCNNGNVEVRINDNERPPQNSFYDCKKEVCQSGNAISVSEPTDKPLDIGCCEGQCVGDLQDIPALIPMDSKCQQGKKCFGCACVAADEGVDPKCIADPPDIFKGDCTEIECTDEGFYILKSAPDDAREDCPPGCIGECVGGIVPACKCLIDIDDDDQRFDVMTMPMILDPMPPGGGNGTIIFNPGTPSLPKLNFSITNLLFSALVPPGNYEVLFIPPVASLVAPSQAAITVPISTVSSISINLNIVQGFRISAKLVTSAGTPVSDVQIRPINTISGKSPFDNFSYPVSLADGQFDIVVEPGTYDLVLVPLQASGLKIKTLRVSGGTGELIDLGSITLK
jgi:hypothetical protein